MSEAPRRINTERSLNRPTEKRPAEAPASKTSLNGQPDFFQPEEPAAPQELPKAKARPEPDTRQELGLKMPAASSGGTGGIGMTDALFTGEPVEKPAESETRNADANGAACGHCDACRLRAQGFAEAGVANPTRYRP